MEMRDTELTELLRLEVANKSPQSSIAFAVFAVFIFLYKFNCVRFANFIQISMAIIIAVSILRLELVR